jgi:transcription elongation factor GreA
MGYNVAMDGKIPMTPLGNVRMRDELRQLKDVERLKISREIGVAREHGDISENAEYHAAKERQGWIEARIKDFEDKLARAEIIDPSKLSGNKVAFGATVKLSNLETEEESVYRLVGAGEANLNHGSISITSPLARALIGREVGDEVKVRMPAGERLYEILEVAYR